MHCGRFLAALVLATGSLTAASSGGAQDGLYRSRDGGRTWAKIRGHGFPTDVLGRIGIAVAPSDPKPPAEPVTPAASPLPAASSS